MVKDLKGAKGVDKQTAYALSEIIKSTLSRYYDVQSMDALAAINNLVEEKLKAGCDDTKCIMEVAGALNIDRVVTGSISKFGKLYTLNLMLISTRGVNTGVIKRASDECKCSDEELVGFAKRIALKLIGKEAKATTSVPSVSTTTVKAPLGDEAKEITRYRVEVGDSPKRGPEDAKVTIIEFSDFQCPFSKKVQPTLDKIMEKYPRKVRVVFKNFPLNFHKDAELAAEAALAAGDQGKFWEMHDKIFNNQKKLKKRNLKEYAQELGLDMSKFNNDLETHRFKKVIDGDLKAGKGLGVRGTPSFFINGKKLVGAKPLKAFQEVIDPLL